MNPIDIAPEVRAVIGDEQARRFATEPYCRRGKCLECSQQVDADREPVSVILIPLITAEGNKTIMRLSHTACLRSQICPPRHGRLDVDKVSGVAGVLPSGSPDVGRPILLLKFPELISLTGPGDRIDQHTAYLLARGFEVMAHVGRAPRHPAMGWNLAYTATTTLPEPGTLRLTDPAAEMIGDWDDFDPGPGWVQAARALGQCLVLYAGGVFTHPETPGQLDFPGLVRAAKGGLLVGGLVTTHVGYLARS